MTATIVTFECQKCSHVFEKGFEYEPPPWAQATCPECGDIFSNIKHDAPTAITFSVIIGGSRTGMTQAGAYEALEFLALSTKGREK